MLISADVAAYRVFFLRQDVFLSSEELDDVLGVDFGLYCGT